MPESKGVFLSLVEGKKGERGKRKEKMKGYKEKERKGGREKGRAE